MFEYIRVFTKVFMDTEVQIASFFAVQCNLIKVGWAYCENLTIYAHVSPPFFMYVYLSCNIKKVQTTA
jgi:hypothetical protein